MDALEKLFGNAGKVKIVKLFLFNPELVFDPVTVSTRAKVSLGVVRRELTNLVQMNLIKEKSFFKEVRVQRNRKMVYEKKRADGYVLNLKSPSLEQLYSLFAGKHVFKREDLVHRISKAVKPDLIIISGFFLQESDSRVDLLVVGEGLKEGALEKEIKDLEANLGKEIMYAAFTTSEFKYRMSVFDKLLRDILDYKHEKVVNKLGV